MRFIAKWLNMDYYDDIWTNLSSNKSGFSV